MKAKIKNSLFLLFAGLYFLSGCAAPQVAIVPGGGSAIPAKIAVAPVQAEATDIELPSSGRKNVAPKIPGPASKELEKYTRQMGAFLNVVPIAEDALPSSPSIAELAQAGRDIEADLVLLGKVLEFEGKAVFGFRPSLKAHMTIELSVYETSTGVRRWHKKESVDSERYASISGWSDEMIEAKLISMAIEDTLPLALSVLIPKLHQDMADYKPPVIEKVAAAAAEFVVDVDRVPRVVVTPKPKAYAVVIGIETYRDLPQAEFAVRDAKIMKEYLTRVMGFPSENIVTLLNERATKGDIEGYMGTWLKNNVERDSTVFIYYGGHGAPNPVTGEAFIIPFDGNPAFPEATGIPLKTFYQKLADLKAKDTFVVMDSCFSGSGGRSVMAKGGRPMAISVENPVLAGGNVVVMTAAAGTEISSSYPEKRHGLFTYFFLKGLQGEADFNGDKTVSITELYNYLTPQVKKIARERQMEQTPTLFPGIDLLGIKATQPLSQVSK